MTTAAMNIQAVRVATQLHEADLALQQANVRYVDFTFTHERRKFYVTYVNPNHTRWYAPQRFLIWAPGVVVGLEWLALTHPDVWAFAGGDALCLSLCARVARGARGYVGGLLPKRKKPKKKKKPQKKQRQVEWQSVWPPPADSYRWQPADSVTEMRANALSAALQNAKSWPGPRGTVMTSPSGFIVGKPKPPRKPWEPTAPIVPDTPWETVVKVNAKRRHKAHLAALQLIASITKKRTKQEVAVDELFFSLADVLRKKGVVESVVRAALTTEQRDMLALRCDVASHVIGSRGYKMWYCDEGYGFSSWLYGNPPANRGHYLVRVKLGHENYAHRHEHLPSVSLDVRYGIYTRPTLDDPYNTYLPPLEAPFIPPPEYPCTTLYEIRLRNINGRPNWTINRSINGVERGRRLKEWADARSEHRAKTAKYSLRKSLVGSIVDVDE